MSDDATLVHVEVDGTAYDAEQVKEELDKVPFENHEFIVSTAGDIDTRTVIDRDALVEDIAEEVASQLR